MDNPVSNMREEFDAIVIGGGVFGALIAAELKRYASKVCLLERHSGLLAEASMWNQARVHRGYHYPRHPATAEACAMNFHRFSNEFPEAVYSQYQSVYAIAAAGSFVSAQEFVELCEAIDIPCQEAEREVRCLFADGSVEGVFRTEECAFDGAVLGRLVSERLGRTGVDVFCNTEAHSVDQQIAADMLAVRTTDGRKFCAPRVLNCTYASANHILSASGLEPVPLKYELAEMVMTHVGPDLREMGVTVMDGPFFSVMPFPAAPGLHTVSHVKYTPHVAWSGQDPIERAPRPEELGSNYHKMIADSSLILPPLKDCTYRGSFFAAKAILPWHEGDDGRPILWVHHEEVGQFFTVVGAKIDNIFEVLDSLPALLPGITSSGGNAPKESPAIVVTDPVGGDDHQTGGHG